MQFYNFLRIACIVTLCLSVIVLVILTLIAFKTYPPFKELFKKGEDIKKEARPFLEEFNKLEDLKNEDISEWFAALTADYIAEQGADYASIGKY